MAPLFLIPVKIVGGRGKARFQIQVDTTQEASPNYSLVEWLQQEHGITIEALSSPRLDESGLDIAYALSAISDALIEAQLPFTVMESSRLLIARFSTYGMWKDLRDHWETFMKAPVFRHLSTSAGSDFPDPAGTTPIRDLLVDETELALPIPADGAQLKAVAAAAAGYSFVLEGPPGTGKSQTITNLIAHALDQGKKILFVAEKQAALDVVRGRLAKVGLAPFTLDLHGTEQSPSAIKRQLKDSIDAEVFYDSHAWEAAVANLRSRLAPLTEYPGRIHDLNGAGHSLWSASSALLDLDSGPEADIPESFVTTPPVSLDSIRETVGDIAVQARITDFSAVSRWLLVGGRIGGGFDAGWQRLQRAEVALAGSPALRSLAARDDVNDVITALRDVAEVPIDQRLDADQRRLYSDSIQRLKSLADQIHRFHGEVKPVAASFSPTFIQSGDPQPLLGAIAETRTGVFGRKKKLARYEQLLRPALPAGIAHIDLQGAYNPDFIESQLLRLPQLRGVAENLGRALNGIPGAELLHGRSALDPTMPREIWQRSETLRESIKLSESHASQLELLDQRSTPWKRFLVRGANGWRCSALQTGLWKRGSGAEIGSMHGWKAPTSGPRTSTHTEPRHLVELLSGRRWRNRCARLGSVRSWLRSSPRSLRRMTSKWLCIVASRRLPLRNGVPAISWEISTLTSKTTNSRSSTEPWRRFEMNRSRPSLPGCFSAAHSPREIWRAASLCCAGSWTQSAMRSHSGCC